MFLTMYLAGHKLVLDEEDLTAAVTFGRAAAALIPIILFEWHTGNCLTSPYLVDS